MTRALADETSRIHKALEAAREALKPFTPGAIEAQKKDGGDPVTAADKAVDDVLKAILPKGDEGWLSEETVDDGERLEKKRVWIVDPLDGTKEFVMGLPEWCVSIALVEDGVAIAGGLLNPATDELILGASAGADSWVELNGEPVSAYAAGFDEVLASRSEVKRGQWEAFEGRDFKVTAMGSVAWKLGLVAAGKVPATWTLVPKNEWDVAAGVALLAAAGGHFWRPDGERLMLNREKTLLPGLVACGAAFQGAVREALAAVSGLRRWDQ
jgi:myo-inositol-1(or 4)-monophosphatase